MSHGPQHLRIQSVDASTSDAIIAQQTLPTLAAVVKELVENSIDAKSSNIIITLLKSGRNGLEVSDDGCGISLESLSFLGTYGATSKISRLSDLHSQALSHGFRGEALFSLRSVANVTITTSTNGREGFSVSLNDPDRAVVTCFRRKGTTVHVSDLFGTVPVRRRVLESRASAEARRMITAITHHAIFSSCCFSIINSQGGSRDSVLLESPGSSIRDNASALIGADAARMLVDVFARDSHRGITVTGLTSAGIAGAAVTSTNWILFTLNDRPVQLNSCKAAIRSLYKPYFATGAGNNPVSLVQIVCPAAWVDVNVAKHKDRVGLSKHNEGLLVSIVTSAVRQSLSDSSIDRVCPSILDEGVSQPQLPSIAAEVVVSDCDVQSKPLLKQKLISLDMFQPSKSHMNPDSDVGSATHILASESRDLNNSLVAESEECVLCDEVVVFDGTECSSPVQQLDSEGPIGTGVISLPDPVDGSSEEQIGSPFCNCEPVDPSCCQGSVFDDRTVDITKTDAVCACSMEAVTDDIITESESEVRAAQVVVPEVVVPISMQETVSSWKSSPLSESEVQKEPPRKRARTDLKMTLSSLSKFAPLQDLEPDADADSCSPEKPQSDVISNSGFDLFISDDLVVFYDFSSVCLTVTGQVDRRRFDDIDLKTTASQSSFVFDQRLTPADFHKMNVVGQFNRGFVVLSLGSSFFMLDQHAAHERVNFEKLLGGFESQRFLLPKPLDLTSSQIGTIRRHRDALEAVGFSFIIDEGTGKVTLTRGPRVGKKVFGQKELLLVLDEIEVLPHDTVSVMRICDQARQILATRACHSSVRVGEALRAEQIDKILNDMATLQHPWSCPHGRCSIRHLFSKAALNLKFSDFSLDYLRG